MSYPLTVVRSSCGPLGSSRFPSALAFLGLERASVAFSSFKNFGGVLAAGSAAALCGGSVCERILSWENRSEILRGRQLKTVGFLKALYGGYLGTKKTC